MVCHILANWTPEQWGTLATILVTQLIILYQATIGRTNANKHHEESSEKLDTIIDITKKESDK